MENQVMFDHMLFLPVEMGATIECLKIHFLKYFFQLEFRIFYFRISEIFSWIAFFWSQEFKFYYKINQTKTLSLNHIRTPHLHLTKLSSSVWFRVGVQKSV